METVDEQFAVIIRRTAHDVIIAMQEEEAAHA
jgi:hypothetical protein